MNAYERVMNRLEGKSVDKIPNLNIVMEFAAKCVGASYREFCTDYRVLVEANLQCAQLFGIDAVSAISDPMREAGGFGAKVIIPEHGVPYCSDYLLSDLSKISKLKPIDPMDNDRMLDRIRAIESFKQSIKGQIPIIGWIEGALAEASDLRDISNVMMDLILEPNAMLDLFEVIYQSQKKFAKAQIEAGADFIGIGNAAASLIGPDLYEQFCLEYDRRIIKDIHDMGAKVKLHICGNTEPILTHLAKLDADIFDCDYPVDMNYAMDMFKDTHTASNGNLNPVQHFMQGTEASIMGHVEQLKSISDSRMFISGGCEIPATTSHAVMKAMNRALYL